MAKAKPFKRASPLSLAGKGPADEITRAQLVALVATHVPRAKHDDERTVRNRISASVFDAVKTGKLRDAGRGIFRLGDVGPWARAKWPGGQFSDVPVFPISGGASLTLSGFSITAAGYTHPTTLQAAIEEVLVLRAENRALAKELAAAKGRIRQLEPVASKYDNWINKKKGKREG